MAPEVVRLWWLPKSQYKEALKVLDEYKYNVQEGRFHEAEACKSTLQRMGAPESRHGERIELCMLPELTIALPGPPGPPGPRKD